MTKNRLKLPEAAEVPRQPEIKCGLSEQDTTIQNLRDLTQGQNVTVNKRSSSPCQQGRKGFGVRTELGLCGTVTSETKRNKAVQAKGKEQQYSKDICQLSLTLRSFHPIL